ncbi:MAG TPA: ATP-dependent DNA helicase UvrD2 [Acidimicrobiia bacterium]|nr:ATP-dependent DNA helicase UvrD2 [Acidimicrobiia bacterium]
MPDDLLLDGLDDAQRQAVTTRATPLAILAGAGAGKTRVLTRRIAWQARHAHIDPAHTLAVTFTRKAAGELGDRLTRLGVRRQVAAGTFHAIALAQLRRRCEDRDRPMPKLVDRKARLLAPMLSGRGGERALLAAEVAAEIEWAKARLIGPDAYQVAAEAARRRPSRPPAEIAVLFERYERERRRRRLVDFDDLITWCADALESDAEFQAAQRWRFQHLFVDEFQDANPAQFRLVRAWLGERCDLCVVGDGDQAIYGFAGADASYLTAFGQHFPDAAVVRLGANYRSSPQVVAAANAVLTTTGARAAVRSPRPEGPLPVVWSFPDDEAEAVGVARALRREHAPGTPWSSAAVLYRTNAQSALFEEALRREGVPFRIRGGGRFLDRPEVQVALDTLRDQTRARPGVPFAAHLEALTDSVADASEERREHVEELGRLGRDYLAADGGDGTLAGFLEFLQTALRSGDDAAGTDAVELLSFHRAKGLEFDTVFVAGVETGLVPIVHAETPSQEAEELRLLYVALSRAERSLHVSWAQKRTVGMRTYRRTPSPWLAAIEETVVAAAPTRATPGDTRAESRGIAAARERIAGARPRSGGARSRAVEPVSSELLTALLEWRRNLARASGVPAYVIFHDSTLEAVARDRPRSRGDLLTIPGIGPVKVQRHGEALLDLVGRHAG